MTIIYNDLSLENMKKRKKKGLLISFLPLIVIVPLFILFNILAKLETVGLYTFLSIIDLSIFAFIFIYQLFENIIKANDYIKHIDGLLSCQDVINRGVVKSISSPLMIKRNISIVEVEVSTGDDVYKLYFDISLGKVDFSIGDTLFAVTSLNYIESYEVSNRE